MFKSSYWWQLKKRILFAVKLLKIIVKNNKTSKKQICVVSLKMFDKKIAAVYDKTKFIKIEK